MKQALEEFDVIVIGAGHAGCEAALATARSGFQTGLFTINLDTIARMPCNPSIGGIGKGHLVKEIDALGGEMALAIDATGIQFRRLNTRKGPAVQASRAQADRLVYHKYMRSALENQPDLHLRQAMVLELALENDALAGVICFPNAFYRSRCVINTAGTFLNGLIHIGLEQFPAGRDGEFAATRLSDSYRQLGFEIGRLKTGTPPRIAGNSIDFAQLTPQPGDDPPLPFSFMTDKLELEQVPCYLTQTTAETHRIISSGLDRSPLYSGIIVGIGPRYCPSIETKIIQFPDKESHQVFLEPEGRFTTEYYANGISTSLPFDIQIAMVRSIPGLEHAELTRPGYAIEYDFFQPTQLKPTLETKRLANLFHAGQINGTSGYEEAAAQGLIAALNAIRNLHKGEPFVLRRDQAYCAVMIDDLCSRGVLEPYRMFTSRAEYRLLLREDNADERLADYGREFGLLQGERWLKLESRREQIGQEKERIEHTVLAPDQQVNECLRQMQSAPLTEAQPLRKVIARPEIEYARLRELKPDWPALAPGLIKTVESDIKYEGYIKRQREQAIKLQDLEKIMIPDDMDYNTVHGLTREIRQRLTEIGPRTLAQAARISGVTPAALSILMIFLKTHGRSGHV
ncbi:tRNA uridine-5-carboxymethylaminomethyl(34) synthesis enzyme MnmG [bacterium]|nr:tRNA uridine-5-carboxymethylaminomethyl(34) synthesis enzyme MnmG [bacterium]